MVDRRRRTSLLGKSDYSDRINSYNQFAAAGGAGLFNNPAITASLELDNTLQNLSLSQKRSYTSSNVQIGRSYTDINVQQDGEVLRSSTLTVPSSLDFTSVYSSTLDLSANKRQRAKSFAERVAVHRETTGGIENQRLDPNASKQRLEEQLRSKFIEATNKVLEPVRPPDAVSTAEPSEFVDRITNASTGDTTSSGKNSASDSQPEGQNAQLMGQKSGHEDQRPQCSESQTAQPIQNQPKRHLIHEHESTLYRHQIVQDNRPPRTKLIDDRQLSGAKIPPRRPGAAPSPTRYKTGKLPFVPTPSAIDSETDLQSDFETVAALTAAEIIGASQTALDVGVRKPPGIGSMPLKRELIEEYVSDSTLPAVPETGMVVSAVDEVRGSSGVGSTSEVGGMSCVGGTSDGAAVLTRIGIPEAGIKVSSLSPPKRADLSTKSADLNKPKSVESNLMYGASPDAPGGTPTGSKMDAPYMCFSHINPLDIEVPGMANPLALSPANFSDSNEDRNPKLLGNVKNQQQGDKHCLNQERRLVDEHEDALASAPPVIRPDWRDEICEEERLDWRDDNKPNEEEQTVSEVICATIEDAVEGSRCVVDGGSAAVHGNVTEDGNLDIVSHIGTVELNSTRETIDEASSTIGTGTVDFEPGNFQIETLENSTRKMEGFDRPFIDNQHQMVQYCSQHEIGSHDDLGRDRGKPGQGRNSWPQNATHHGGFCRTAANRESSYDSNDESTFVTGRSPSKNKKLDPLRSTSKVGFTARESFDSRAIPEPILKLVERSLFSLVAGVKKKVVDLRLELQAHVCGFVSPMVLKPLLQIILSDKRYGGADFCLWAFRVGDPQCFGEARERTDSNLAGHDGSLVGSKLLEILKRNKEYDHVLILATVRKTGIYPHGLLEEVPNCVIPYIVGQVRELIDEVMKGQGAFVGGAGQGGDSPFNGHGGHSSFVDRSSGARNFLDRSVRSDGHFQSYMSTDEPRSSATFSSTSIGFGFGAGVGSTQYCAKTCNNAGFKCSFVGSKSHESSGIFSSTGGFLKRKPSILKKVNSFTAEFDVNLVPEHKMPAKRKKYAKNHYKYDNMVKRKNTSSMVEHCGASKMASDVNNGELGGTTGANLMSNVTGGGTMSMNEDSGEEEEYDEEDFLEKLFSSPDVEQMLINEQVLKDFSADDLMALKALRQPHALIEKVVAVIAILKNVGTGSGLLPNNVNRMYGLNHGAGGNDKVTCTALEVAQNMPDPDRIDTYLKSESICKSPTGKKSPTKPKAIDNMPCGSPLVAGKSISEIASQAAWSPSPCLTATPALMDGSPPQGKCSANGKYQVFTPKPLQTPMILKDSPANGHTGDDLSTQERSSKKFRDSHRRMEGSVRKSDPGTPQVYQHTVENATPSARHANDLSTFLKTGGASGSTKSIKDPKAFIESLFDSEFITTNSDEKKLLAQHWPTLCNYSEKKKTEEAANSHFSSLGRKMFKGGTVQLPKLTKAMSSHTMSASTRKNPLALSRKFVRSPGRPARSTWGVLKDIVLTKTLRMELVFLHLGVVSDQNFDAARELASQLDVEEVRRIHAGAAVLLEYAQILLCCSDSKAGGLVHAIMSRDPSIGIQTISVEETYRLKQMQQRALLLKNAYERVLKTQGTLITKRPVFHA